jgi:hypothetical protein
MILLSIKPASNAILIASAVIVGLIIIYNFWVMWIASEKIFPNSGTPISMAQTVLNSIQATSQFLFGLFVVTVFLVLTIEDVVKSDVGIPVITSVVGFLLGRTQKKANDA